MTVFTAWQRETDTGQIIFDQSGYPIAETQPGARTFLDMQNRVQDEVLGPATTTHIQNAIGDAIGTFEREQFWFNELRFFTSTPTSQSTLTTIRGKESISFDDFPPLIQLPHISKILVLAFNNRYPLRNRTPQWMDDQSISLAWQGLPTDWCWESGALRFYPIPQDNYPLIMLGTIRFRPPDANNQVSPWFNEAEAVIRTEAKRLLFTNIARDAGQAQAMTAELYGNPGIGQQGYLAQLRRETQRRAGDPQAIRPSRGYMS